MMGTRRLRRDARCSSPIHFLFAIGAPPSLPGLRPLMAARSARSLALRLGATRPPAAAMMVSWAAAPGARCLSASASSSATASAPAGPGRADGERYATQKLKLQDPSLYRQQVKAWQGGRRTSGAIGFFACEGLRLEARGSQGADFRPSFSSASDLPLPSPPSPAVRSSTMPAYPIQTYLVAERRNSIMARLSPCRRRRSLRLVPKSFWAAASKTRC